MKIILFPTKIEYADYVPTKHIKRRHSRSVVEDFGLNQAHYAHLYGQGEDILALRTQRTLLSAPETGC